MALNHTDMTLQRLAVSLGQLVDQLQVTKATKKDIQIEDVIKALNLTFKTTKGDINELKSLLKVSKSTGNAAQYEKLIKMLELLVKSYDNPDVKQMNRLGITTQNLIAEISSLRDEVKNTNIKGNEKANLSLLSQAIAEGQKQYALSGFGKYASNFYKKATLDQIKLLQQMNKNIKEGIPLKDLGKKGIVEKTKDIASKASGSGLLQAGADIILKGMGFGTLPGELIDMFMFFRGRGKSKKEEELTKEQELNALRAKGLLHDKEKAQLSLDANRNIQERALAVKQTAGLTKENLTVELGKTLADAMRISGEVDARFASEENPGIADVSKITEAIKNNSISKSDIENTIKATEGKQGISEGMSEDILRNFDEVQEYSEIISEQEKIIKETAMGIQSAIDTIAELFLDIREIFGKELKNELEQIDRIVGEMKGHDEETIAGLKSEAITSKLSNLAQTLGTTEDELHGIIGGESNSRYMREYERQGSEYGGKKGASALATEAFRETSFREALYGEPVTPKVRSAGAEFEERVAMTEQRLRDAAVRPPSDLQASKVTEEEIRELGEDVRATAVDDGLSLKEISEIVSESITEFLKNFEESMKERDKDNKEQSEILRKALLSGEVKVTVVNLKDMPAPQVQMQGSNAGIGGSEIKMFGD